AALSLHSTRSHGPLYVCSNVSRTPVFPGSSYEPHPALFALRSLASDPAADRPSGCLRLPEQETFHAIELRSVGHRPFLLRSIDLSSRWQPSKSSSPAPQTSLMKYAIPKLSQPAETMQRSTSLIV